MHSVTVLLVAFCRRLRSRAAYGLVSAAFHILLVECALAVAFLLRFEFAIPAHMTAAMAWGAAVFPLAKLPVGYLFSVHRACWQYFSTPDLKRLIAATAAGSFVAVTAAVTLCPHVFPRSVLVLDFFLTMMAAAGAHVVVRVLVESAGRSPRREYKTALIYGAGAAGVALLRETRNNPAVAHRIRGFLDDDPLKQKSFIQGLQVLGTGADLKHLAAPLGITEVLIAIPSAAGDQMSRLIQTCQDAGISFRTIPALSEIISGRELTRQIRDVTVDDLLGRSAIRLDRAGINAKLRGRVALVTGAAGSIGSELCRQIAACQPAALIVLDIAETPLFHIERELKLSHPDLNIHPEIASIQNVQRLREIFAHHRPNVVYHAAAYKHVPMMEANVFEAIENNVIGTYNVAVAAADYGAEDFVMISSDKAVRPTNIMGVTKRTAELVIRSLQNGGPRYISVRFGNVLGSNGSVVPIFKQQIAAGGPVTVTHPEMRRYFMTIPEAVQLVLQASTMGKGGEIFVLDMGTPVRILDLARQLIILSGLRPDEDIRIEFSGVRPGEKLYEELHFSDEEVLPTSHEKIKVFAGHCPPEERMAAHLARLRGACDRRDIKALLFELKEIEPDYNPSKEILSRAFEADLVRLADAVSSGAPALRVPEPAFMVSGD